MGFQQGKLLGQFLTALLLCGCTAAAQELYPVMLKQQPWHGEERSLRYHPEGADFVIRNGSRRFNRAIYGSHTAFRVEAGDLPEFALYMPGMGGNLQIGLSRGTKSLWLIKAQDIIARYTPGKMSYVVHDPLLGKAALHVVVLALADAEGLILKAWIDGPVKDLQLVYAFGGASGKKFSRSGDMGPDPESSFYLKPEDCTGNQYSLNAGAFNLKYAKASALSGVFPAKLKLSDAGQLGSPSLFQQSDAVTQPAVSSTKTLTAGEEQYVLIREGSSSPKYNSLAALFDASEASREKIAGRIKINTPDPYINTIGAAISIASDAIWEEPSYMHGAVGWRMRLNGWRGPYTADPLGWHDRAKTHFRAYAKSQVLSPLSGPVIPDTAFHLARHQEKMGTSMFSSGYISRDPDGKSIRPHHYDMNLVYIDELLWHFNWTGDLKFAKEMWPVIQRHLAWEKRNFDPDNDGLYDAYAVIWASDALYYSGGAVTHSSAYNYRANVMAARIAALIGESPRPYQTEASKILKAMNTSLWLPGSGVFAEYKDALGLKQVHPSAALWTVYHSIDSNVPDAFQAYQSLRYVDESIPHIPVNAKGLDKGQYYTLSTTSWMPYTWSLNNVVMAESMHTALANWQAGRNEEGFKLFKSELLADMYLGGSPGNFVQISHYDAVRGEAYRDFADPVGISSRALVEGLFGIVPDALDHSLVISPGFPAAWDHASISTPDIFFSFKRKGKTEQYTIMPEFGKAMTVKLRVKALAQSVSSLKLNGSRIDWQVMPAAIGMPVIEIKIPANTVKKISLEIVWKGEAFKTLAVRKQYAIGDRLQLDAGANISVTGVNDPQKMLSDVKFKGSSFTARLGGARGSKTAFIQLKMNGLSWWYPLCFELLQPVSFVPAVVQEKNKLLFAAVNHRGTAVKGFLKVNGFEKEIVLPSNEPVQISISERFVRTGTNTVSFVSGNEEVFSDQLINWNVDHKDIHQRSVDLSSYFNAGVTQIFKNKYLSPRPQEGPTLQIPWQGIGDWPHSLENPDIDDTGLRKLAGSANQISLPQGIQFRTPGNMDSLNILFSSRWDNYPAEKEIPLSGKAGHAYLLMAGSTNPMQSQFDNGKVIITYTDGSSSVLILRNPESWWPIQEDYYTDDFAFGLKQPRPPRIHLKTGLTESGLKRRAADQQAIPGGAATVLDLPLDQTKDLKSLRLVTLANDVVIGLMGLTLTL
ncbi:protein of unknown function [Pedobacter westerhofensis]|uniref:Alpha-L-rhamnosidase six-hairpin glycosidase domain-containing protein n=1 Tax=Pedobacter westerhofensis TaxID=425512 RepID=A0A521FCE3_9SPHI|nr:DUF4450 domain-containing protein [Pedobacter westerhofensis]SMO93833.1 protein of unknown function [Pedobacter westerhofensis]